MENIVLLPSGKEEFVEWINASTETNEWMHSYNDYECYKKMLGAENIRFMSARTKSGDYVGSCICFVFPQHAFVAAYYIRPEFRKRGIGTELFSSVVNDELRRKNIGLHAAPAMTAVYEQKLGFIVKVPWKADRLKITDFKIAELPRLKSNLMVKDISEVSLEQLIEYDTKIAKANRNTFVQFWIYERPDAISKVILNSENKIVGYGSAHILSVWDCPIFGPIYGDNDSVFGAIFGELVNHFKEQIQQKNLVDMSVPSTKFETIKGILDGIAQIKIGTEIDPLFTRAVPDHDIGKIYGISVLNMFI